MHLVVLVQLEFDHLVELLEGHHLLVQLVVIVSLGVHVVAEHQGPHVVLRDATIVGVQVLEHGLEGVLEDVAHQGTAQPEHDKEEKHDNVGTLWCSGSCSRLVIRGSWVRIPLGAYALRQGILSTIVSLDPGVVNGYPAGINSMLMSAYRQLG